MVNHLKQAVIPIQLRAANGVTEEVAAVIDSGFDGYLTLTPELMARLQFPFGVSRVYELGDGREVEFILRKATLAWNGSERTVDALETDGGILVGMSLLSGYRVCMDVVDGGSVIVEDLSGASA